MQVGDIYKSRYWGDVEIVSIINCKITSVMFRNTGNVAIFRQHEIKRGNICDKVARDSGILMSGYESPQRAAAKVEQGIRFPSNSWGDVEVVQYNSSVDVLVRYVNSGNLATVQLDALRKGLVSDIELQKQQTREKREIKRQDTRKRVIFEIHVKGLKKLIKDLHKWKIEDAKNKRRLLRELAKEESRKNAKQISDMKKTKEYKRKAARENYEANREKRLQQAKDWQTNNPEKARVRNRNARARRMGAEGSSTLDEQNALLQAQNCECAVCKADLNEGKHLDHIMPLILRGSNWISNLQWLCPFCNLSKNDKHPDVWAAEIASPEFWVRRNSRK